LNTQRELSEMHSDEIGHLRENLKALRSRVAMRELRARKLEAPESSESLPPSGDGTLSDDEKARVRRELGAKLANGSLKPIGR
jgi:hypothetical protein